MVVFQQICQRRHACSASRYSVRRQAERPNGFARHGLVSYSPLINTGHNQIWRETFLRKHQDKFAAIMLTQSLQLKSPRFASLKQRGCGARTQRSSSRATTLYLVPMTKSSLSKARQALLHTTKNQIAASRWTNSWTESVK